MNDGVPHNAAGAQASGDPGMAGPNPPDSSQCPSVVSPPHCAGGVAGRDDVVLDGFITSLGAVRTEAAAMDGHLTDAAVRSVAEFLSAGGRGPTWSEWRSWSAWSRHVWIEAARSARASAADEVFTALAEVVRALADAVRGEIEYMRTAAEAERLVSELSMRSPDDGGTAGK